MSLYSSASIKEVQLPLCPALCVIISGGLQISLSLGWSTGENVPITLQYRLCWFVAYAVGAFLVAPLMSIVQKRWLMMLCCTLALASGLIFVIVPNNYVAILVARYLNGFANGFATVPYLVHAAEVCTLSRGVALAIEQYCISMGIIITLAFSYSIQTLAEGIGNLIVGIFTIVTAAVGLGILYFVYESPIYHLRKNDETQALQSLLRFYRPSIMSEKARTQMIEIKEYVKANTENSGCENFSGSLFALIKVLLYRCMVAFSFSLPLNEAFLVSSVLSVGSYVWPVIVFSGLRLLAAIVGVTLINKFVSKIIFIPSLLIMGALTIGIGIAFNKLEFTVVLVLSLLTQCFAGIFVPSTSACLGEAFSMILKPYFIAFSIAIEQVVHIIVICTFVFSRYAIFIYSIATGAIMVGLSFIFWITLPNLKKNTLLEAENRYSKIINIKN
ncbi:uncharacterized protein LOC119667207 [Teleopsis dalmanni]|uniref:uncharacterized protein LOC119667207 n=1 Tax=Teleopsis dalmanni TaxID=139649 RepID=UPI0018CE8543|nr:uncharacterized protein LOC119667207 [Teleopsis dalmanni]